MRTRCVGARGHRPTPRRKRAEPKPKQIGVVLLQGGPYYAAVEGLREGLRTAGLEEGRNFELVVRNSAEDLTAVEAAARGLEHQGVDLIVAATATPMTRRFIRFLRRDPPLPRGLLEGYLGGGLCASPRVISGPEWLILFTADHQR